MWTDFVNWKMRRKGENGFLLKQLNKRKCQKIFDACLGDGVDSIYLLKRGFDIIHTHGSLTKAAFLLKKICGLKWVHTFHAIERVRVRKLSKEEKHFEDLISWIESTVNYCNGAIYVSNSLYRQGKRLYPIKKNTVIPNGVDTDFFKYFHEFFFCTHRNNNLYIIYP